MDFFAQPAFFALLAVAVVPAAVLGFTGRRIKRYGLVASVVFLALLFSKDLAAGACLLLFVVLSTAVTLGYARHRRRLRARAASTAGTSGASGASGTSGASVPVAPSRAAFFLGIAVLIAPLAIYKLTAAAGTGLLGFLGVSYLTFKAVQVFLEVHDDIITEFSLLDYLGFLLFFAPFTSGPIDRSRRFAADAERRYTRDEYQALLVRGILLLLAGVVYKAVIAAVVFDFYSWMPTRSTTLLLDMAVALKNAYSYGIYLFFDFAGYSLMAMGASYCFGIRTPRNFRAPFASIDIKDFWNRWHMTLSFWLRDFVFMRFTRLAVKRRWFSSRLTTACCGYVINMGLMGVWHGITADYLAYGLFHGLLLAATEWYQKKSRFFRRNKDKRWYKAASWALTVNLVFFGFALFSGQVLSTLAALALQ
ncbi:MAG: D-alanyl-lipoteichoic acid biosynthesis protein DltB [Coriobacteriales bacterium]|nr:D-alanyl-lipoteichoic acid biosynthesis protein DltB [Coriobacteriales bacterium]